MTYNLPAFLRLLGRLDAPALAASFAEIVRRHEALRTTFSQAQGRSSQVISPPAATVSPQSVVDLGGLAEGTQAGEARRIGAAEVERPFDLARGPLLRISLVRLAQEEHLVLLNLHHIVSDGWSMGVLVRELGALYRSFHAGEPSPLPELPLQYADFAVWQRQWLSGSVLEGEISWWHEALSGLASLALPTDHPRPFRRTGRGAVSSFVLPLAAREALEHLSRSESTTLFMTLLGGLSVLLSRSAGQTDVAVGSPIANRTHGEVEGLIGFFVNTLVLRTDLSGEPGFRELLSRVRRMALSAYAHQDLPFEKLVEAVSPERDPSRTPLFQVLLALQNAPRGSLELPGLRLEPVRLGRGTAKFDLTLTLLETPQGLSGAWEYSLDLFEAATLERLSSHLSVLLGAAVAEPDRPVSDLPLLTAAERAQLLVTWNGEEVPYPRDSSLPELFAAQTALRPDAVAVSAGVEGSPHLSYGTLSERADCLALRLQPWVQPGDRVGLCLDRSIERVVATLAILAAGGAYVPLDPSYPQDRLDYLVRDSVASVLLTERRLLPLLPATEARVICLDEEGWATSGDVGVLRPLPAIPPTSLAYLMYTSGSTGTPKGVAVPHRAVVRLVRETGYADFGPEESWLQFAPFAFDASTLELWGALLHGGRVVMPPPGVLSLAELGNLVERHGVTALWLTAGLFHQMVAEGDLQTLSGLRHLLAGGDVLSPALLRRAAVELPGTRLICGYGPTENTTFTTCHTVDRLAEMGATVPLGLPIAHTSVYVLDLGLSPVPVGVAGELCTGGDGLAWGYLGRPELTAERFVPSPFGLPGKSEGERLYRTGDLVRWRAAGWIEFLGRIDGQVKIRGFRIEPGEIEMALTSHPAVESAVVLALDAVGGLGGAGDRRLVAYLVLVIGSDPNDLRGEALVTDLQEDLKKRVPEHMVPAAFVFLDALPLTANGKVDRKALPTPGWKAETPYLAPRSAVEAVLAELFSEVLGIAQIGVLDGFFRLGGHSLQATQLVSRVQGTFRVKLPLRRVFESPTVEALAAAVIEGEERTGQSEKIARALLRLRDSSKQALRASG